MFEITTQSINQLLISHHRTCQKQDRTLHMHNNAYELLLFKSGNVDYFINDVTFRLMPGDLIFICPNDIHGLFISDETPYERMPVHFEDSFAASLSTPETDLFACFRKFTPDHPCHLDSRQLQQYEACVDTIINSLNKKEFGYDIRIRSCLSWILLCANEAIRSEFASAGDVSPEIIRQALGYVNNNLTHDISIQTIAAALNISGSRLSHIFKNYTGTSLWNYIIARRIQHAGILLKQGASITDACYECGFNDYSHFVKVFHKIMGVSPGKYVKNIATYTTEGQSSNLKFL